MSAEHAKVAGWLQRSFTVSIALAASIAVNAVTAHFSAAAGRVMSSAVSTVKITIEAAGISPHAAFRILVSKFYAETATTPDRVHSEVTGVSVLQRLTSCPQRRCCQSRCKFLLSTHQSGCLSCILPVSTVRIRRWRSY